MENHQLETWVLRALQSVEDGLTIEDSRLELKAVFPEPSKAAGQLAGHANASRGEYMLWVIGVDDQSGVISGVADGELQAWLPQVQAHFDELAPALVISMRVPWRGVGVSALLFDTSRRPYVIRDGKRRAVKWRHGDHTADAGRGELLGLLTEAAGTPSFEVLGGELLMFHSRAEPSLNLSVQLYQERRLPDIAVVPYHRARIQVLPNVAPEGPINMELRSLTRVLRSETPNSRRALRSVPYRGGEPPSSTLVAAEQLELDGPARVTLKGSATAPAWLVDNYQDVESWDVEARLPVVDGGTAWVTVRLEGRNVPPDEPGPGEDEPPRPPPSWCWPAEHNEDSSD